MEKQKSRAETHSQWSTTVPSTTGPSGGLPLVPCPKCRATMIWAVSGSSKNQGREYYKCPRNEMYSGECDTFMWKDQYKRHLSGMIPVEQERRDECPVKSSAADEYHQILQQFAAMKTSLDQMNDQITKSIQKSSAADEKLKIIVVSFFFLLVGIYIGKIGN